MIQENIDRVREQIAQAAARRGRDPNDIKLCAVTKNADVGQMMEALSCGVDCVGESRVGIAAEKFAELEKRLGPERWAKVEKHMIGSLQTNKVKAAVELFSCIQSVDSLGLAKEIDRRALSAGKVMKVMIEVNIAGEEQKHGISPSEVEHLLGQMLRLTNIKVVGLMCIAPWIEPQETRPYFAMMKKIDEGLGLRWLSMGMSNDFGIAIEEGSNMVRVGSRIFGDRDNKR